MWDDSIVLFPFHILVVIVCMLTLCLGNALNSCIYVFCGRNLLPLTEAQLQWQLSDFGADDVIHCHGGVMLIPCLFSRIEAEGERCRSSQSHRGAGFLG